MRHPTPAACVLLSVLLVAAGPTVPSAEAQTACAPEVEPNDDESSATPLDGPVCVTGALPDGDQDLAVWDPGPDGAATQWTFTLEGIPGVLTLVQFFPVTSEPGAATLSVERVPLVELTMSPEQGGPILLEDVLLPAGRYLVGVARSDSPGGGQPAANDYRLRLEPGRPWPANADVEPNDDTAAAQALTDAFEVSGDRQGSRSDFYAWTVTAPGRWDVAIRSPLGEQTWLDLQDATGGRLDSANAQSEARLFDLDLEAGSYGIRVAETGAEPHPYVLSATPTVEEGDAEPNDDTATAVSIVDGEPVRGRLAKEGDKDRFSLSVPTGPAMLREARMIWRSGTERSLCLLGGSDETITCARAAEGISMPSIALPPGDHVFEVSGVAQPSDTYMLRVDVTGPASADFEAEPNETLELATPIDLALGMTARGGPADTDLFRLPIEGEAQLWQIDLAGSELRRVELVRANGAALASADLSADGSSASLADLYLVPGDHWLRVTSTGPEYRVAATALGPPDPDGEREPNDTDGQAQRYRIGARRVGRLPRSTDRDVFRFTLAAPQHIQFDLAQPPDAATALRISSGGVVLHELTGLPAGEPVSADLWLGPGDHFVELAPERPGEGTYELTSVRLDPFASDVDREPNDSQPFAGSIPDGLAWSGDASDAEDTDWYLLPPLAGGELRLVIGGDVTSVRMVHPTVAVGDAEEVALERAEDGSLLVSEPPLEGPTYLVVKPGGPYELRLEGAGLEAVPPPEASSLTLALDAEDDSVAAYWPDEQVIEAGLQITNDGPDDIELDLTATTSHRLWRVDPQVDRVTLPAGGNVRVPLSIVAAPDAWADEDVQVAVQASAPGVAPVSTAIEVQALRDDAPLRPRLGWTLPSAILGSLDVASLGLGGVPMGRVDAEREAALFDGVTPDGGGFSVFLPDVGGLPLEIDVDLAGEDPIAVSAIVLHPQAGAGKLDETPSEFELLLSDDSLTWDPVLTGVLEPEPVEQPFLLDAPVPARYARLRILDGQDGQPAYLWLGEWKVLASPGSVPFAEPIDIGDPALGGHVVTFEPFDADPVVAVALLDQGLERHVVEIGERRSFDMVVGFADGRAAQVTDLEWHDPDGSDATTRMERVDVLTSRLGPTGPWRLAGTWELVRDADGGVAPFRFEDATWVRYLRLVGPLPFDTPQVELPGDVRVHERPTDGEYRSIVGEWGYRSSRGPYEWSAQDQADAWETAVDAADSLAEAVPLPPATAVDDIAEFDVDEDWHVIDVPADDDSLEIVLAGRPIVGVQPTLYDAAGAEQPLAVQRDPDGRVLYTGEVVPGARYALRLHQPPFSTVFAYDTSPSMDPYRDMVVAGMRSFLSDVRPGREAATVMPFEERPLVDGWQDDPYVLQDAFDNHVVDANGSSGAETSLVDAADLLEEREGARAILLVTDAETSTYERTPELWDRLARSRPLVFSVHIGAVEEPVASRERMQDWAAAGGGYYSYPSTHGEMDRAFDRMATWLRRPAAYTLAYETRRILPATISVTNVTAADAGARATTLARGVGVEVILDTSGSMLKKLGGKRRIDVAKATLRSLFAESLAEGVPVALRTFGGPGSGKIATCATTLTMPLAPLDRAAALRVVKRLKAVKKTATPIATALGEVTRDLSGVPGLRSVVLITDGDETCDGDPAAAIAALREAGVDARVDIVGLALDDDELKGEMAAWATAGGGTYYDAASATELASVVAVALSSPFRVYGLDGEPVAAGKVGGESLVLDPGTYRVEVLTDPPIFFDGVELADGASVTLELPAGGGV